MLTHDRKSAKIHSTKKSWKQMGKFNRIVLNGYNSTHTSFTTVPSLLRVLGFFGGGFFVVLVCLVFLTNNHVPNVTVISICINSSLSNRRLYGAKRGFLMSNNTTELRAQVLLNAISEFVSPSPTQPLILHLICRY